MTPGLYKNKYRIASARAEWWNYGWNGAYFITICTLNRKHFFGECRHGKMVLSDTGVIADVLWYEIPVHAPYVELGDFVVMPNHIHGILIMNKSVGTGSDDGNVSVTVSSIIGSYKSAVTKHANRLGFPNGWQSRFHDHIIRNDAEYQRISDYIAANPLNWKDDKFYSL